MTKTIEYTERGTKLPPQIVDDLTRREFLIGAGLIALAPACGGGEEGEESASGETRTVEHALGTTEVPVELRRIASLGSPTTSNLVSLGLTPAAAGNELDIVIEDVGKLLPEDLNLDSIERVGSDYEPDLEAIAAVGPGLIIGDEFNGSVYDKLSEIAPTVLVEWGGTGDWRRRFLDVAEAVGRTERAREVEANYEQMVANLPEVVRNTTVAFIRPNDGQFLIDSTDEAFPGSVAEDAGISTLTPPEGVGEFDEDDGFVTVSDEMLDVVEAADLIVVPDFRSVGEDSDSVSQFEQNALWETLPAVREGNVLQVPGLVYNGGNHYAAELLLREIERALTT